jgi:heme-degrading monooxygenase HmoA
MVNTMFVLHLDLTVKAGLLDSLQQTYCTAFVPAISSQEGFARAELLRPIEGDGPLRLILAFEDRTLQQRWVATDLHQQVWGQIERCCDAVSLSAFTPAGPCQ